jgi:GTP-binding protein
MGQKTDGFAVNEAARGNPFRQASFVLSAARVGQCPPDEGREIAFAGRSNAGKSSALNTICGIRKLARTSNTPGRTQLLNFFEFAEGRRLVDLPGYGFAKVPIEQRDAWGKLVEDYVRRRQSLAGVVLLMDVRHPLKPQDHQLIDWVATLQLPLHVLLTKADKISRSEAARTLAAVRKALSTLPMTTVQLFSALKSQGVDEARAVLQAWYDDDGVRS